MSEGLTTQLKCNYEGRMIDMGHGTQTGHSLIGKNPHYYFCGLEKLILRACCKTVQGLERPLCQCTLYTHTQKLDMLQWIKKTS